MFGVWGGLGSGILATKCRKNHNTANLSVRDTVRKTSRVRVSLGDSNPGLSKCSIFFIYFNFHNFLENNSWGCDMSECPSCVITLKTKVQVHEKLPPLDREQM